ncbi:Enoyl-CoA hydratase [Pseudonocardia sp. Ae406_Ps2]|uniref:enoyl-CoA hydratase n=1 Tax=unclassified Pseudonocardia TaxID=2619320 RepID=UPI00094B4B40|nr:MULTISPECIES: enoyl-CoA hydratase [unclassified Pseudonocardia]OLM00801.1 Enoyl-CoA hydratase [Pseudonocardia sp. Ae406_Ps2]OLM07408.1 Enoyl-CoA hydratase [Pseudonocardia sp. Ae331_Ps2]OLM14596.1 Enoyl-CoA hydratase [Pseudonocardia sp. Ae505_Ps2]OLM22379.1 Enoyl-CoA hydratase [Pseudonocardia sp. Ae706_Ps2]OLM31754.1 Enoyl-CoA hydratase [Pseudonocardia sp. Ae717_Ps2]
MISVSTHDDVGLIELNRPERRNALDIATCRQLVDAAAEVRAAGARAVVVAGNGSAFCSGADFGEVYTDQFLDALYTGLHAVADLPMPTVAAVTGPAIGGGLQLALACDLRVAAPEAVFGLPTARLGLAVDPWTIERLVQIAGGGTARSLLLACATVDAATAHARGLADTLGDRDAALALARDVATMAPLTLAYNKRAVNAFGRGGHTDPAVVDGLAADFRGCWAAEDIAEGRAARTEKRVPVFRGR